MILALLSLVNLGAFIYTVWTWLIPVLNVAIGNITTLTLGTIVGAFLIVCVWLPVTLYSIILGVFIDWLGLTT